MGIKPALAHLPSNLKILCIILSVTVLSACSQSDNATTATSGSLLAKIHKRGRLIVLTTNLPTSYYYNRDNQLTGPEYDMSQAFARFLKVKVEYKLYDSTRALLQALKEKKGDIAANGLTVTTERLAEFDYGPVYQHIQEYLVCRRQHKPINRKADLKGLKVMVAADTSYIETLKAYPDINWVSNTENNTSYLLQQVAAKKINCTISDSTLFDIERRYHIELQNKYTLAKGSKLAWMLNKHHEKLKASIDTWFKTYKKTGKLAQLMEKYYGYVQIFDYVDTHKFLSRIKTRLPQYKAFFIQAAAKNNIRPSLLAAQSYQESHWNRKAKSPTGVRGIMMLTQPVAKSLGVSNRLNARQNIFAGAKFFAKMKKMVAHAKQPDRSWLALAAYNIGRGHFRDAQSLARKRHKNPNIWVEMKTVLPLLARKKYYKTLRYGYARGSEPVRYVARIRGYDDLLQNYFPR